METELELKQKKEEFKLKQKEYNKKYHEQHKEEKKAKATVKKVCQHCGKTVDSCHMVDHMKTSYCMKRRQSNTKVIKILDDISKPDLNLLKTIKEEEIELFFTELKKKIVN